MRNKFPATGKALGPPPVWSIIRLAGQAPSRQSAAQLKRWASQAMKVLGARILNQTRTSWLRTRPVFRSFRPVDEAELIRVESKVGVKLPADLRAWLLVFGYGDVDDVLSFRYDWFHLVEEGHFKGAVIFAQDELGNFYAFTPGHGPIVFLARSVPEYVTVSPTFQAFMEELERRDFKLLEWMDGLALAPYEGDAFQETRAK